MSLGQPSNADPTRAAAGRYTVTVEVEPAIGRPEGTGSVVSRVGRHSFWTAEEAVIEATAPCLPILFDESGMALADLTAEADAGAPASSWEPVDLEAADLAGLASTWLNELMREAGDHRAELVDVAVDTVAAPASGTGDGWRLHGRVGLRRLFGRHGPARYDLRTSTSVLASRRPRERGRCAPSSTRYQTLHPLMTTSGRRRATRRSWPAASATRTTLVTSL